MPDSPVPPSPMGDLVDASWEVEPQYVQKRLADGSDVSFVLLDCRRAHELEIAKIEPSVFLPMQELAHRYGELDGVREREIIVYCHHGRRSLRVSAFLREKGFANVKSMAGGIDRWAQEIDTDLAVY